MGVAVSLRCLIGLCVLASQTFPRATESRLSLVSGDVINTTERKPAAGVTVALSGVKYVTTETDSLGRFRFQGVRPGKYALFVDSPSMGGFDASFAREVIVASGASVVNITLEVRSPGSIEGRLLDSGKQPLPSAQVELWRTVFEAGSTKTYRSKASAVTGPKGEFSFGALAPGRYFVVGVPSKPQLLSQADGEPPKSVRQPELTVFPEADSPEGGQEVVVEPGKHMTDLTFRLREAATYCVDGLIRSGLAHASGSLIVSLRSDEDSLRGLRLATGRLALDSPFRICGLWKSRYVVEGIAPGKMLARLAFDIDDKNIRAPAVDVTPPMSIHGSAAVPSSQKAVPPGLTLTLAPTNRLPFAGESLSSAIDPATNTFVFSTIYPGEFLLKPGTLPPGYYIDSAFLGNVDCLAGPFEASSARLDVSLATDGGSVRVLLLSDLTTRQVAPTGTAFLISRDGKDTHTFLSRRSDQNGVALFETVAPGSYVVVALIDSTEFNTPAPAVLEHLDSSKEIQVNRNGEALVELLAVTTP